MDTVTEADMAIAMARAGGIGVLHKNMTVERQAAEVDRVKRSESGMILNPITLGPDRPLREAVALMRRFRISGVPIVDGQGRLVGIITNRDLQFERNLDQPIRDAMTKEKLVTAPVGTDLDEAERILARHRIEKLPVVDAQGVLKGLITVKDIFKRREHPLANKDQHGRLRVAGAVGGGPDARRAGPSAGGCRGGRDRGRLRPRPQRRRARPRSTSCGRRSPMSSSSPATSPPKRARASWCAAGSMRSRSGSARAASAPPGWSPGVGVPQVTAILDSLRGADDVPIIADGGVKYSGDAVKALAAGASSVMMGSMLAGTEESPGESVLAEGRRFKMIRGMGSLSAMQDGSADRYFQEGEMAAAKMVPEGIEGRVPYKGPVADVLYQMVGGLRSGMGYCGVSTIPQLQCDVEMIQITTAGLRESHPHDVTITREAPNYSA